MSRQLFQVVAFDVRVPEGPPVSQALLGPPPCLPLSQEDGWQQLLQDACEKANVGHLAAQARAVAEHLGVAVWDEIIEVADQIAQKTGMKVLERRRFMARVR